MGGRMADVRDEFLAKQMQIEFACLDDLLLYPASWIESLESSETWGDVESRRAVEP